MKYRSSASFGKRQEYVAVAELLRRNFDVYMTLVDDQQIDCIIRQDENGCLRYLDIQIKARSRDAKQAGTFAAMEIRKPRPDFWFIFYSEAVDTHWIMSSEDVVRIANKNKQGKNKGKCRLVLCNKTKDGWKPRPKFDQYKNAFELLKWKP